MVGVPCGFVRLGAMIKSVIFVIIRNFTQLWFMQPLEILFSHVRSMRPVICILLVTCDGSMWEPVLITQLFMYLSHVFASW